MALPASGTISLNSLQTEFGGSNPISINEYYRGGTLVNPAGTNTTVNNSIPTSGAITLSNFYGGRAFYGVLDAFLSDNAVSPPASVSFSVSNAGVVTPDQDPTYNWVRTASNSVSDYEIRVENTFSSVDATTGTFNTWLSLGTTRTWSWTCNTPLDIQSATASVSIRLASTLVVVSTATLEINVSTA